MEDVCLQHLEWDRHLGITIRLQPCIYSRLPPIHHLPVEKLLSRLSGLQEILTVEHAVLIGQVTADVPALHTRHTALEWRRSHLISTE